MSPFQRFTIYLIALSAHGLAITSTCAAGGEYSLQAKARSETVQVGENIQIELTIPDVKLASLGMGATFGQSRSVSFVGYIGYEPKTPGIKKIGPFAIEFHGQRLLSNVLTVEVTKAWAAEEGYEFRIFPRIVQRGTPIRVVYRHQYLDKYPRFVPADPPLAGGWMKRGDMGLTRGGQTYTRSEYWYDIPSGPSGKRLITQDDLPMLPPGIAFEPIEVEVVDTLPAQLIDPKAVAQASPMGDSKAFLLLDVQPKTVQEGGRVDVSVVIQGISVASMGESALPEPIMPLEWSQHVRLQGEISYTPELRGLKTIGPFSLDIQGQKLVSNAQTIEIVPGWPRDVERYEFRVFPRSVIKGSPVRIVLCQQYSEKPFIDTLYNNLRNPDPRQWSTRGGHAWMEAGRKMRKDECWIEIPTSKAGTLVITKSDLPEMPPEIAFEPIEVKVLEPH